MKVVVLGANGLIGSTMFRVLASSTEWDVVGTVRDGGVRSLFSAPLAHRLKIGVDLQDPDTLVRLLEASRPDVVINCIGVTKHLPEAADALVAIPVNSVLPHSAARLCGVAGIRFVHISTDCVFSGARGFYSELDVPDAADLYGRSKALGEVDYPNSITIRTSTIGHELMTRYGLLEWFLMQTDTCRGFSRAVFSGLPTTVLAQILRDEVIPRTDLTGLMHIAAEPITKYDLLRLIAEIYEKPIEIVPDARLVIDRSLDPARFREATGYVAPPWEDLLRMMHSDARQQKHV
jgi:dTDP-4-dehydrorhamnose reductase